MPGICFDSQPSFRPSDDPVSDAHTCVVIFSSSQTPSDLDIKLGLNSLLEVIQISIASENGEVVTVDDESKVTRLVGKTTGRCSALGKAQSAERLCIGVFPPHCGTLGAVHAPGEPTAVAGPLHLGRQFDKRGSINLGIEVSLSDIDEKKLLLLLPKPPVCSGLTE